MSVIGVNHRVTLLQIMKLTQFFHALSLAAIAGIGVHSASAQTVTTDAVGFNDKTVPADSDVTYSPSLHRPAKFSGVIESIVDADTIQISNASFSVNEFAAPEAHYVVIGSGDREGMFAQISANAADTLDLTFFVQDLGNTINDQVLAGDEVKIIPFWTLGTLLPDGDIPDGTQVLLYDRTEEGINNSAEMIFTMFAGFGWFDGPTNGNGEIIMPDESFKIRAPSGTPVQITQVGAVQMEKVRTLLENVTGGVDQDIRVTTGLAVPIALQSFLNPGAAAEGDQVLIYSETDAAQNKSAEAIATYFDGFGWFDGPANMNGYMIQPNQGLVYRKLGSNSGNDLVISFTPDYQQPPQP